MPVLTPLSLFIWEFGAFAQAALLLYMLWSRAWLRWPAVYSFLLILTLRGICGMAAVLFLHSSWFYFWSYWWLSALALAVEVWMMVEVFLHLTGATRLMRRTIGASLPTLAIMLAGWTWEQYAHAPMYRRIPLTVIYLYQSIGLAWLLAMLLGILAAEAFGYSWSRDVRAAAVALLIETTAACAEGWVQARHVPLAVLSSEIKGALFLLSLFVWAFSMCPPKRQDREPIPQGLLAVIGIYTRLFSRAHSGRVRCLNV